MSHQHDFVLLFHVQEIRPVLRPEGFADDDGPVRVRGRKVWKCGCGEVKKETYDEIATDVLPLEGVGFGP